MQGQEKRGFLRRGREPAAGPGFQANEAYPPPYFPDFAEVYIEADSDVSGGEPLAPRPEAAAVPADPARERFTEMRRLSRNIEAAGVPGGQAQNVLFYRQARFMEGFEDEYEGDAPFSMYYPCYQMMGYEQLRTYFSWRSRVRQGVVQKTSFSYVFLYLYELINNVGVQSCEDGLRKLAFVWNGYRGFEKKLDAYLNVWVRDYYITNDFAAPFEETLQKDAVLREIYTRARPADLFGYYFPYADYKVKQSGFWGARTEKAIAGCFAHVAKALNIFVAGQNTAFDDLIFYVDRGSRWAPFSRAVYCPLSRDIRDKTIRLSDTEVYRCENGRWTTSQNRIVRENGRALLGYILRRIEQFYRRAAKYRYRLTADRGKVSLPEMAKLLPEPERLFAEIDHAIVEYYRLSRRKTITVDAGRLETIRANAQKIQEKLLAGAEQNEPEATAPAEPVSPSATEPSAAGLAPAPVSGAGGEPGPASADKSVPDEPATDTSAPDKPVPDTSTTEAAGGWGGWGAFLRALTPAEKTAVRMALQNASVKDLQAFAQSGGAMLEVLADGINQKALEAAGDTLLELGDEITLYGEYRDALERELGHEGQ